uniref:Transmembrane protein n=1 Tax=Plectus sambesii TaxID=2011161 RepID=A0A914UI51_9BILA
MRTDRNSEPSTCGDETGAKILAFIDTVSTVLYAVGTIVIFSYIKIENVDPWIAQNIFCYLLGLLINVMIVGLFWYGLIKERHGFLIPTLICSILGLIGTIITGAVFFVFAFILMTQNVQAGLSLLLFYMALFGGGFGLQCWFYCILKNAYSYLEHKRYFLTSDDFIVQQMEQACVAVPKETPTAPPAYEEAAAYSNFSENMAV